MKKTITPWVIAVVTGLFLDHSANAQNTFPASGNAGVGTSSPNTYLAGTNGLTLFGANPGLAFSTSSKTWLLWGAAADNSFRLFENSANLDRITVLPGGSLGVGTTTPGTLLHTRSLANTDNELRIDVTSGSKKSILGLANAGTDYAQLYFDNATNNLLLTQKYASGYLGFGTNSRTTDLVIANSGNIGINTTSPTAKLQVQNGSVLFDGTTGTTPVSGAGTRMMWIPEKAAFRAGWVSVAEWDNANIGAGSFAVGGNTKANGYASFAANVGTTASAYYSTAFGVTTIASGFGSFASGYNSIASGHSSTVFGKDNIAQSYNSFVLGAYNYNSGTYDPNAWVGTDPLLIIGNGTSTSARSNAVTVLKNGNTGIGTYNPAATLHVAKTTGPTSNHAFRVDAYDNPPFIVDGNGNVGVGTSTISSKLEVRGGTNSNSQSALNVTDFSGNSILKVRNGGKVTIGAVPDNKIVGNYSLYVKNGIITEMCKISNINTADWSDFVFYDDYNLMPLYEVEKFIKKHKHLPDVPSALEVSKTGIDVAKMDAVLLQKIEELTLYNIQLQKQMDELNKQIEFIKAGK